MANCDGAFRRGVTGGGREFRFFDWREPFGSPEAAARLPYCLRIVLENCLRGLEAGWTSREDIERFVDRKPDSQAFAIPMVVSRVVLPDSSGLPVLMDLAGLRDAAVRNGLEPRVVQPRVPIDLVVDHSLIVEQYGSRKALDHNIQREYERNGERYAFFKWAQNAFGNVRVVPPGKGIVHQINLEHLAQVIGTRITEDGLGVHPEFVLGGDSHTPMVNGLGVLGWGVGGVEIEAAVLGEPYVTVVARVVGVRLGGRPPAGTTVTDIVLKVTERLRELNVSGAFVEFFGPSYRLLTVPDRATIANMAPEYGATTAYFPIDDNTIAYLLETGRGEEHVALIEAYARQSGLFHDGSEPQYDETVDIDLDSIRPSVSGPKRPQDRCELAELGTSFRELLAKSVADGGYGVAGDALRNRSEFDIDGKRCEFGHGSLAIAAITACTSTSNPALMLGAGLLAKAAVERGLGVPPFVKTSLAPGSLVVAHYLSSLGLVEYLERLGFHIVGFGCATCSGNSGPLSDSVAQSIQDEDLVAAAVVSSNRNFEGRLHRLVKAGYLASPALVVAFAIAGRIDIDLTSEPLGTDRDGKPVFLRDIWPAPETVAGLLAETRQPGTYSGVYDRLLDGDERWKKLPALKSLCYPWDSRSTYILPPPFFEKGEIDGSVELPEVLEGARVLGLFGDGITTDHISPGGEIPESSHAGRYLSGKGIQPPDFNAYLMRRGNHHVMMRGTYANVRIQNRMIPGQSGGFGLKLPEGEITPIYDLAEAYRAASVPQIVIGGKDYGMGSSRDWAAKGPALLGVGVVIAVSFERIHRSNLIALGIVPLLFKTGENAETIGLTGRETFDLTGLASAVRGAEQVKIDATAQDGSTKCFLARPNILSDIERVVLLEGGLFRRVYRKILSGKSVVQ